MSSQTVYRDNNNKKVEAWLCYFIMIGDWSIRQEDKRKNF